MCWMFNMKLTRLLNIPTDYDARGIVVRTLDHKYYLRSWTLRFIDPYVNVEFQTYMRKVQLHRLRVICVLMLCVPIYIGVISKHDDVTHEYAIRDYMHFDVEAILYAVSGFYVFLLAGAFVAIHTRVAYAINIQLVFTCLVCATLGTQSILLSYAFDVFVPDDSPIEIKRNLSLIQFGSAYNLLYRAFPLGTCVLCIYVCLATMLIVDIMMWYVVVAVCTFVLVFTLYESHLVTHVDFRILHEYFDAGLTTRHIISSMIDIPHDELMLGNPKYLRQIEAFILEKQEGYRLAVVTNTSAYSFDQHPLYQTLKVGGVTPYIGSVFDTATLDNAMTKQIAWVWMIFIAVMTFVIYQYNLSMRTIFILTRVRSNKDAPRNLDGGIRLQELAEAHIGSEDRAIAASNLETNKKTSTTTDSSGNECVDERVKELELMTSLVQLEMGERLSQLGTVKEADTTSAPNERASSVASDSLSAFARTLVPRTYTESVQSGDVSLAIAPV